METDPPRPVLVKIVQTCQSCPSQWDAWDSEGNYWYLRYRHSVGTAERQRSSDIDEWVNKPPELSFDTDRGRYDGTITLEEFCQLAGLGLDGPEQKISY